MKKLSIEAKVGFFVIIGILILGYMSMRIGRFKYGPDRGYEVYGYFDSAEHGADRLRDSDRGIHWQAFCGRNYTGHPVGPFLLDHHYYYFSRSIQVWDG